VIYAEGWQLKVRAMYRGNRLRISTVATSQTMSSTSFLGIKIIFAKAKYNFLLQKLIMCGLYLEGL
jgi:hypothetical protein